MRYLWIWVAILMYLANRKAGAEDASSKDETIWNKDNTFMNSGDRVPNIAVVHTRSLREHLLKDKCRPGYHFVTPEGWGGPRDSNGAFYANGRYHLMYLYSRQGAGDSWGHIASKDLVHWRYYPDGLTAEKGDSMCLSGGAFVDDDGTAYLSYWKYSPPYGVGLAKSNDRHYSRFEKFPENPVIESTENGVMKTKDEDGNPLIYGVADPSNIWKKDGIYYMLAGNGVVLENYGYNNKSRKGESGKMSGDWVDLFRSTDLKNWEYMHRFYERNPKWTRKSEDNMCPSFLPLPTSAEGGPPSDKHLLLFISHYLGAQYYIGDYRNDKFHPIHHGRMAWIRVKPGYADEHSYFAPEALIDDKGRHIMWACLLDNPADGAMRGWSGVFGLPRTLWLGEDGTLRMAPVPELEVLRQAEQNWNNISLADGQTKTLENVEGDSCELEITIQADTAKQYGVKVRTSPGGEEETLCYYDDEKKKLVFDSTRSGSSGRMKPTLEQAPFELRDGEDLKLRVFVDKSVIEIYANDRQAIARQVYCVRDDSLGIVLFANGGRAKFSSVKAWDMMPSNPY